MCKFCDDREIARLIDVWNRYIDGSKETEAAWEAQTKLIELALYFDSGLSCSQIFMLVMYNGVGIFGLDGGARRKLEITKLPNIKHCPNCGRKLD